MPALKDLQEQMVKAAHDGIAIHDNPDIPTAEKLEQLERQTEVCKSLSDQIAKAERLDEMHKQFSGIASTSTDRSVRSGDAPDDEREYRTPGEQWTASDAYLRAKSLAGTTGSKWSTDPVEVKTTLTEGVGGTGSSGTSASAGRLIREDYQPGPLPILFQPVTVADLIPSGSTNSNTVRYPVETTATNAASSVSEGGTKPEITLAFQTVDEPVRKLAAVSKISEEALEDISFIRSWIDGRLMLFLRIHEELQLLSGNGVAPDLTGILNRGSLTAAQALSTDTRPDCIFKEITKIRIASFLEPDAIVMHPSDYQDIRLGKDGASQYYGGGPFMGQYGNGGVSGIGGVTTGDALWGKRVVSTQNISAGTVLVGAFGTAAQIFRRTGLSIDATNSDGTDFLTNLITIRCEERLALAVYRPAAFGTCTGM